MANTLEHDLETLALFIETYCRIRHPDSEKHLPNLLNQDLSKLSKKPLLLCEDCHKLLAHAVVKRSHCPMDPKPMCKHCPNHCYHPVYREKIREVMKVSGQRMVMTGRLDFLVHLLF